VIAERGQAAAYELLAPLSPHAVARLAAAMPCRVATTIVAAQKLGISLDGVITDDESGSAVAARG
jgi:hypothetical protein